MNAKELHNLVTRKISIGDGERPLLIAAILMALSDSSFLERALDCKGEVLPTLLLDAVERVLGGVSVPGVSSEQLLHPYQFISAHPALRAGDNLRDVVHAVNDMRGLFGFGEGEDTIGQFYANYARYEGTDRRSLGIVLTPRHIADLMVSLLGLTADDVVLDTCIGTGVLLQAAREDMIAKARGDKELIDRIVNKGTIGAEQQLNMHAIAIANRVLEGATEIPYYLGSCFEQTSNLKAHKATAGIINPPYSLKGEGQHEFDFILQMLDCLEPGSPAVAIVPIRLATAKHPLKSVLLENHTLKATMSMPDDIFNPVGINTVIMVFTAGVPHGDSETWFGYWKEDGFSNTKTYGRADMHRRWEKIKNGWLADYSRREAEAGKSALKAVKAEDEWCVEAYMETDYTEITKEDFEREIRSYMLHILLHAPPAVEVEKGWPK